MEEQELNTPEVTQSEVGNVEETNEPTSMIEAIEAELKPEAEQAEEAQEAEPEQKAAEAQEDELAMPEGLNKRSQERFRKLIDNNSELKTQLKSAQDDIHQFQNLVRETQTSPEEFGQLLNYARMVKNGDFDGALRLLDDQRKMLALQMGRPLPGADPLQDFPDLRQRVEAYQMDEQAALEIARSRKMEFDTRQAQERQFAQRQSMEQQTHARQSAIQQIDQLGANWAKSDPDYAAKEEVILKQLPVIAQNYPPHMWAGQITMLYKTLSSMPAPQRQVNASPLRPTGQVAGNRQPASMLEAISSGLGYANS